MRAFDLNFARAARIFDPNFMRTWRKAARLRGKIFSGERALRGDEILNGGGILSGLALNVGKILSGEILNGVKIWSDSKILNGGEILRDCGISGGDGILNLTSRGGTRRGFCRRVPRELCGKTSLLRMRRKFQSASGSQIDYKFKRVVALQTDRKFKIAAGLRTACKFKALMQKFHRGFCAAAELLRQKLRSETMPRCIKFQSPPYAIARLKFQGAMSEIGTSSPSAPLKFQISVAALLRLKFQSMPSTIALIKFQSAIVAAFARSKFKGSPRAAQCCKIRAQGQGG